MTQGIAESRVYLLDPSPAKVVDGRMQLELALRE